jgi:arginase
MSMQTFAKTVSLIGAATGLGQERPGLEDAPQAFRSLGLLEDLASAGLHTVDLGDVRSERIGSADGAFRFQADIGPFLRKLAVLVAASAAGGAVPLVIGGDHGIALGSIAGMLRVHPDLRVIWVDAHGDMNTPDTSPTGNFHGMPVSALLGAFHLAELQGFEWLRERLCPERFAIIGARSLDAGERDLIERLNLTVFSANQVRSLGVHEVLRRVMRKIDPAERAPFHLSFDIDALDPSVAPATGVPVDSGLTLEQGLEICSRIRLSGRLVGMDLVEVNPFLETPGTMTTLQLGARLIREALGTAQ